MTQRIHLRRTLVCLAGQALLLQLATAPTAHAQQDNVAMTLGEVVASGRADPLGPRQILTSVNLLAREQIDGPSGYSNFELFSQVPGVTLGEYLGKGMGYGTLTLRGFNGEGVLNAAKLLIDGVPSNANDGNTYYIDLVPRIDIDAVEVVKGTNDPRYGLHNIAGNANLVTRTGGNHTEASVTAGSFGTRVLQMSKGIETDTLTQNYAFSTRSSDGYRDHMRAQATNLSAKWFWKLGQGQDASRIGLIVRHLDNSAEEPGYLTAAQLAANPWQVAPKSVNDRDARRATQVAIQTETVTAGGTQWQGQVYWNHLDDDRYIKFPDASRQEFRMLRERHVGASLNFSRALGATVLGDTTVLGGIDTERQDNLNFRERPIEIGSVGQSVVPRRDHTYALETFGGFLQAIVRPSARWTITPALRVDKISGTGTIRYDTDPKLIGTWPVNPYGLIKQPKLSAAYALDRDSTLYANWGRTFQAGTGRAAYMTSTSNADVSINEGWELGYKFKPMAGSQARIAAWQQTASNETRTLLGNPSNDTVNLGQTRRRGVDVELNARPRASTSVWMGASFQSALILSTDKEVDHVPRRVLNLGVTERLGADWRLSATVNNVSSSYVDATNSEKRGAYTLVNTTLGYRFNPTVQLDVQVRNLTNRRYDYGYDNTYVGSPGNFYAPNMPRSVNVTLGFKL